MTDFTTAQLTTILSALAGKPRKPKTRAEAMRAIARHAAAIGRTGEAALAFAPGLLEGWLDAATWRDQLAAAAELAGSDEHGQPVDGKEARPLELNHITFRAGTNQALIAGLLEQEQGATLDELIAATGWLPHTTRAALTGLLRKGFALDKSIRENGKTAWHIEPPDSVAPDDAGSGGQG
jgi:hypothetical protein